MLYSVLTRTRMFSLTLALLGMTVATSGSARDFEVWLVDQSDSFGKTLRWNDLHLRRGRS